MAEALSVQTGAAAGVKVSSTAHGVQRIRIGLNNRTRLGIFCTVTRPEVLGLQEPASWLLNAIEPFKAPRMSKPIHRYLLLFVLCVYSSFVWSVPTGPGGKGQIKSSLLNSCFKNETGTVSEVCAKYTISWKLWSLMGEPMGDYSLTWELASITLKDPQRKLASTFFPYSLPNELKKPVAAIELYIEGVADVTARAGGGRSGFLHFDTGVAIPARPDAVSSLSPGSPNWDKMFVLYGNACDDKQSTYMNATVAKETFKAGVQLSGLRTCPGSGASNLTSLEGAIADICNKPNADKKHPYCPNKKSEKSKAAERSQIEDAFSTLDKKAGTVPTAKPGSIDDAFGKVEASREAQERSRVEAIKSEQERERQQAVLKALQEEALAFCKQTGKSEESCQRSSCGNEPSKNICTRQEQNPSPPCGCSPKPCGCLIFPSYTCVERKPNPGFAVWESCVRSQEEKCTLNGTRLPTLEQCVAHRIQASRQKSPELKSETPLMDQVRRRLREATKCQPNPGEKCTPRRNGGSGIKG